MKKTLNTIFDEATAGEIETLVSQNDAPDISADTLFSIKNKVYAKTGMSNPKTKKPFYFRWQSYVTIAACLALLIGTGIALPMLPEHSSPNDTPTLTQTPAQLHEDSKVTYSITMKNGVHYINFSDGNTVNPTDSEQGMVSFGLYFPSLGEMKDAFLNNRLSDRQIQTMKKGFPKDENGIIIPDMNELYEPTLPDDLTTCLDITLNGSSYSFYLYHPSVDPTSAEALDTTYGMFSVVSQEIFDRNYANELSFLEYTVGSQTKVEDRDATVYKYYSRSGAFQLITYDLSVGDKVLHICEKYTVDWYDSSFLPDRPISYSIPYSIQIYGCENGQYFEVLLHNTSERPSVEWLSSFGLTEYVDTNTVMEK